MYLLTIVIVLRFLGHMVRADTCRETEMVATCTASALPKTETLENLTVWLRHLEAHPEQDVDCTLEVRVPLSYLTRLMLQGEREDKAFPLLVRELLEQNGYGDGDGITAN
ncbi:hypothetical protein C9E81_17610 [Paracoccus alkanivorans]|uniref:Uncharacterized protein n=1 Tax=Paracoccus alkanivorans TaxID=2116655 RepID=A0A3M0M4Y3_9RHOB|nr:hypothetical protein C9E81_17610 [Paracoccus alkanivorans]